MKASISPEGILLRIERLRQDKEQKEVCTGICAVSTLSKIETGRQNADPAMLKKLYEQLGIHYTSNETVLARLREQIEQFFEQCIYQHKLTALDALAQEDKLLRHSPLAADWLIIRALTETGEEDPFPILRQCQDYLDRRQKGWYLLALSYSDFPASVENAREADRLLQNSFSRTALLHALYTAGEYRQVLAEAEQAASLALLEGNLWTLAESYQMRGTIYACFNMEDMMLTEYKRAAHLLSETRWQKDLRMIFYNIGATYLGIDRFQEAEVYLDKASGGSAGGGTGNSPSDAGNAPGNGSDSSSDAGDTSGPARYFLWHKLALLYHRTGRSSQAGKALAQMKGLVHNDKERNTAEIRESILELTALELSGQADSDLYLTRLEALMEVFFQRHMFGYMMFYHNHLRQLYTRRRLYRKAYLLEQRFSDIQRNSSL